MSTEMHSNPQAEVLAFNLAPPLQRSGRERISADLAHGFATGDEPIGLEIREPRLTLGAFCTKQATNQRA